MQPNEPPPSPPGLRFEDWEVRRLQRLDAYAHAISRADRWTILGALGMATGIELAGRTASAILLTDLQGNAGATIDQLSWVLIAYNTGYICSLGVSAGFVRSFGTRKLWLTALLLFGLGNLLTFVSHQLTSLLIARSIAGLGGGVFLVRSIVFLRELFAKQEMARAVTMFNTLVFSFKGLWPILMGAVSDATSWGNAFLTQIPFIALSYFIITPRSSFRYWSYPFCVLLPFCGGILATAIRTRFSTSAPFSRSVPTPRPLAWCCSAAFS